MALRGTLASLLLFPVALFPAVRLKSRSIETASGTIASPDRAKAVGALLASEHRILEFAAFPSRAQLQALEDRGAHVLQYVPDNAVMVNLAPGTDLEGLGVRWTGALEPSDKVSPELAGVSDGTAVVVEFHPDTDPVDARWAIVSSGADMILAARMAANHLLVRAGADSVRRLAERDEVAYVFPAPAELERGEMVPACQGAMNALGGIGQYASSFGDGWDGPGLGATTLSFSFASSTDKVPEYLVQTEIMRALATWSKYVQVDFSPGPSPDADRTIKILFGAGDHGDPFPFDGPGGVLAHTFFPAPLNPEPLAGDVHFDADEGWKVGAFTDIFSVALHELGHALGLGHSDQPSAVMYPYYKLVSDLRQPDIDAIRQLYAATDDSTQTGVVPAVPADPPNSPPAPGPAAPAPPPPSGNPTGATPSKPPAPAGPTTPTAPSSPSTPTVPAAKPAAGGDTTAPLLTISSPGSATSATTAATITVSGHAADTGGVKQVVWFTTAGDSGGASGTTDWQAGPIPLYTGTNTIIIRAFDNAGNMSWKSLVVTRRGN